MSKVIGKLKLAPYVPAWYDMVNEIHLVRPHHVEQDVKEGADLEPIMRGVFAGYVIFDEMAEEVKEEVEALKPQKIGVDMKAPETPVVKKKRKSKKKAEEVKEEESNKSDNVLDADQLVPPPPMEEEDGEF